MRNTKEKRDINSSIQRTEKYMTERLGIGTTYDVDFRQISVLKTNVQMYYVNGLTDDLIITQIMQKLVTINDEETNRKKVAEIIKNRLVHEQVDEIETMDEAVDQMLSGLMVIFIDGYSLAYVIDVRDYPGRDPEEPDTERVIRGARDGYTENIVQNTALTRRRIRDTRLRNEMLRVGERSKTDVCLSYLKDVADNDIVEMARQRIKNIEIDGIPMADKTIEEFIVEQKWNAYPLVRYTERPDVAAEHLYKGHVLLMVDTSPSVIALPTTFFDHMEHAEESRQSPTVGTYIRWIRVFAVLVSLYLMPVWLLFVLEPSLLPKELSFIGPEEESHIPISMQIIMAEIGVELIRLAAVHTPTPLATALGLVATILIGEIAVDVGMFNAEVILYAAASATGTYVTPSYELSVANKVMKFYLLLMTIFFGVNGLAIGFTTSVLYLAQLKALNTPYLWPFIPFNLHAFIRFILRIPVPLANSRPDITHPKNDFRQPVNKR